MAYLLNTFYNLYIYFFLLFLEVRQQIVSNQFQLISYFVILLTVSNIFSYLL